MSNEPTEETTTDTTDNITEISLDHVENASVDEKVSSVSSDESSLGLPLTGDFDTTSTTTADNPHILEDPFFWPHFL